MVSLDSPSGPPVPGTMTASRLSHRSTRASDGESVGSRSQPEPAERSCVVCGASLVGHRQDARHCSPPCRADGARPRAILSANSTKSYLSVAEWIERREKRAQRVRGLV